jgi:hypothetical protein
MRPQGWKNRINQDGKTVRLVIYDARRKKSPSWLWFWVLVWFCCFSELCVELSELVHRIIYPSVVQTTCESNESSHTTRHSLAYCCFSVVSPRLVVVVVVVVVVLVCSCCSCCNCKVVVVVAVPAYIIIYIIISIRDFFLKKQQGTRQFFQSEKEQWNRVVDKRLF